MKQFLAVITFSLAMVGMIGCDGGGGNSSAGQDVNNSTTLSEPAPSGSESGGSEAGESESGGNPLVGGDPGNESDPNNDPFAMEQNVYNSSSEGGGVGAHSPEPVTLALSALGLAAVGLKLCRRRR